MKGFKVCIDEHVTDHEIVGYNAFFTNFGSALDYINGFETDKFFEVRLFPVDLKVKYHWTREYEDK